MVDDAPEPEAPVVDIAALLEPMMKSSHTGQAVWAGAILDDALEHVIADRMRNMSKGLRVKIFDGTGSLATFSAKIDVAYALAFISITTREDLLHIKAVRNAFAHAPEQIDFHAPAVKGLLAKFRAYKPEMDPLAFFAERVGDCYKALLKKRQMGAIALALLKSRDRPGLVNSSRPASPKKSE